MARMDYGVIPIVGNKINLYSLNTGAGNAYHFGNLNFYKFQVKNIYLKYEDENPIYLNFEQELDFKNKIVMYWDYEGIQFKTKKINRQLYLTTFKHLGIFKKIIHGYDVDIKNCYDPNRLKLINKMIRKLTK